MLKPITLALFAAIGVSHVAVAAIVPVAVPHADASITTVAERCGYGGWRSGLDNRCRPLGPYAHGAPAYACPAGWHLGPMAGACWPNR